MADSTIIAAPKRMAINVKFVICGECFWCSSLLRADLEIEACPSCHNSSIEALPVSKDERYTFHYTSERGIVLAFTRESKERIGAVQAS